MMITSWYETFARLWSKKGCSLGATEVDMGRSEFQNEFTISAFSEIRKSYNERRVMSSKCRFVSWRIETPESHMMRPLCITILYNNSTEIRSTGQISRFSTWYDSAHPRNWMMKHLIQHEDFPVEKHDLLLTDNGSTRKKLVQVMDSEIRNMRRVRTSITWHVWCKYLLWTTKWATDRNEDVAKRRMIGVIERTNERA